MIKHIGSVTAGWPLREVAEGIKLQSYKVNTPKKFHVHPMHVYAGEVLKQHLSYLVNVPVSRLDFVYFSCCNGAEEHVDLLDPAKFEPTTFVVPIILPRGKSTITADGVTLEVEVDQVYEFNHELPHRMDLEDTESGCVVLMVAVLRDHA
jgi:hypothetical protein